MAEETEKQEGQKTVVAFIAGLLIGGLLVWVFSSSPEDQAANVNTAGDDTVATESTGNTSENTTGTTRTNDNVSRSTTESTSDNGTSNTAAATQTETVGDGELVVPSQAAGSMVVINDVTYPTNAGWIAVRDYAGGVPGRILGASRYNLEVGLTPASVKLLRDTLADTEYQVVFYTEDGDEQFNLANDTVIEGLGTTFTAQ